MRILKVLAVAAWLPGVLAAQDNRVDRLKAVLPAEVADRVIQLMTEAASRGLPGDVVADRALEAQAKGRPAGEIPAAARQAAEHLANARAAVGGRGREPDVSEIQAGAAALELGVNGKTISTLARSAPSGRSLAVPLAVLGALVNRGLPSDDALAAVRDQLAARASNTDLVDMPGEAGRLMGEGHRPAEVGRMLGSPGSRAGDHGAGPPPGVGSPPPGPPGSVPSNRGRPAERPGNSGNSQPPSQRPGH